MESQILLFVLLVLTALVGCGQSQEFGSLPPRPTTGVRLFLGEENMTIANFSMIAAGLFHDADIDEPGDPVNFLGGSPDGQNDGLWCQSSLDQNMIGTWYRPDGTTVPLVFDNPLFANNTFTGQIGLLRNGGIANLQGLYSCVIPNEEGINQTLYVAAYGNGDFLKDDEFPKIVGSGPSFQLLSSVDADPPVFSLSFNVTNRPPTIVTCSVDNGDQFNVSDNDLIHTVTPVNNDVQVQVSVIFRMRVSGLYACSVTTERITIAPLVSANMSMRNITVTGSPSNLAYNRDNSLLSVTLDWSPSAVINDTSQYLVFVTNSNGMIFNDSTMNAELSLSLRPDDEYNIRLVAIDEDINIPSEIINVTVPQVVTIDVQGPVMMPLDHSSSFSLTCTLTLAPEVNDTMVEMFWVNPDLIPFISTTDGSIVLNTLEPTMISVNDSVVYTLTLNFCSLQASQVGEYICGASLNDGTNTVNVTSNYSVSVQVPTPVVTTSLNTTGRIFESNDIQLLCFATFTLLDVDHMVIINWFGPNGLITMNDTEYSISTGEINSTTNGSSLAFTASLSDNGTDYYCTASVGPAGNVNRFELIIPSDTITSSSTTVIVEIVPLPMINIMDVGIPVTGDSFQLVCTGTAPANLSSIIGTTVSVQWLLNGTVFTNDTLEDVNVTNSGSMATLSFSSLNASTHERDDYTCEATLSIPNVPTTKTANIMYNLQTLTNPVVSVFASLPVSAGQIYALNCTVTIVAGVLNITWLDSNGNEITGGDEIRFNLVTISDNKQRYDLIFNSLDYSNIGVYTCRASLTVDRGGGDLFNGTGSANTTVSIRIPLPQVSISPDGNSPFILGTVRTVNCSVNFTPPLPTNPDVSFTVFKDGEEISFENSSRVIAVQTGTNGALTFQPLNFSDAGNYTCTATARDSANNPLIIPRSASDEYIATVQAIPEPNITFNTSDNRALGGSLAFSCELKISVFGLFKFEIRIRIEKSQSNYTIIESAGTTAMVTIDSLRSSDAGDYQCIVDITQPDIDYEFNGMETAQVILTLPAPSVIVKYNATGHLVDGELAEGQFLDIMCIADISQYIDTSVSVTMSWRRNNTVLTNGSDFTISPPVMTNNQYTGVLRINSLRDELDNGASYNCTVSVTPNTPFIIAGNDNSSAVTLTVARFDINHVGVTINIPSVPVAGDVFNLSCVIVVPPNFVENLTSVRWTYDLEASRDVTSENNDATLVPVVRNGNIFTSVLTLDPVKTTDARRYYCQATFVVFGINDGTNRDLTVQIPPPSVSIVADPPTGPIYESTGYFLTCTATVNTTIVDTPVTASAIWTDPSGNVIPTNEARREVIPPTGNSLVSMLLFLPIDTGLNNDGGTYTCQMIINSGNSLITSSQRTDATLTVTVESLPPMTVDFSSVGSVEVGQSLTITCTITTVERLVVTPMVTFIKMNDTDMEVLSNLNRPYSITTDDTGAVTNYTLILDPVRFEDAGMYTCMAEFNVTGANDTNDPRTATYDYQEASDTFNLTVDFPPVIVTISKERDDTLYAGTPFFIKCDIMLDPLVTIPVTVTNQWTRDGTNVPMGSSDATITKGLNMINTLYHNATLMFYPLDNADDSGMYTCNVEVTAPNSYTYLRNTSASANTSITVMATPVPVVEIVTMGMAEPGEEYILNCTVTVVDRLIVSPVIIWTKRSANNAISVPPDLMIVSNVMTSLYLNFSSLNTSDAGLYTCEASINVSQISMVARNNDTSNLPLEIPIPSVDVSQSRENYFLAGSNLILTCDISVDPNVDTPFAVNVTWNMTNQQMMSSGDFGDESGPNSTRLADTDRVNISSVMMRSGFNEYRSIVNFTTLSSIEDSGTYTCIVTIVPDPDYEYVMTSDTNYMNVNFTVTDPMIGNFSATPDSFLGLETSCPDSFPYDKFTLTCTATKPTIVIPDLVIAWTHNDTIETGTVTTTGRNMTTTVTNTLSFDSSTASDSGTYRCTASITIPESMDITTSEESTVAIRSQSLPVPATNVTATPGTTTAAISFIIPNIAYTPETYSVKYTGMILQTTEATSILRMSSYDITAVNQEFTIMLTGLEEDNTYTYTVDSTNCLGTTSTVGMTFRTIPTLPVASPLNCANITFLPRNVTLTWTEPALIDQNGAPVGYNLTCMNTNGVSVNGLNSTQTSMNTMFTIDDVMPFTGYTCELSFINVVGEGPSTQCTFETAQDTPDDGPQNFASTPTMTTVTFRWSRPSIPNGIITGYQLKVANTYTNNDTVYNISVSLDQTNITQIVDMEGFFRAYQSYFATVTARTIIGFGPISTTSGRTLPDISSPPLLVTRDITISGTIFTTLPSVNNHTINVTWSPPTTPNGRIMNYTIDVDGYTNGNNLIRHPITDVDKNSFMVLITNTTVLNPGVPYNVTLVAYNEFGRGIPVGVTVFTRVLTPSVSPSNVQAVRSDDGTNMTITWDKVSLEQARGFFEYTIRLTRSSKKRQGEDTIRVPFTETSYTATDLDDQATYGVSMGLSVDDGSGQGPIAGPTSPPIEISSPASTAPPTTSSNINTIIGIVVGVVLALLLIVLIVFIIIFIVRRGKQADKFNVSSRSKKKDLFELLESNPLTPTNTTSFRQLDDGPDANGASAPVATGADGQEDDDVKEKPDDRLDEEMILERMKPIAVASFHEHVQEMHVDSDKGFEMEYKSVPMQTETSFDIGRNEGNKTKNRFANIFPYDFSRVKLTELSGVPDSDYINACYIDGYNRKDCYIAAQGPLPSTVADFWRTIWEYRINHIVMLTGVVEGGKKKCEQYWPEKVGENLELPNGFTVTMTSFVQFADYIIRDFKASKADSDEKDLTVSHYHFTSWPDHGVPQFATSLISFIKRVQKDHNKDKGVPLMVHCSAGVGRTGTFIMLDIMMDRLKQEESINVYEVLRQLRSKRMYMVQTQAQYVFLHDALDELTTCGDTSIIGSNLRARVNKMHKMIPGKNITGFQEQYELLDQVGYKPSEMMYSDGTTTVNVPKNRYPEIVPLNMHRPRLRPDGSNGSDYINASFVDGYKQRNAYIVTQGPLKNTVDDFWRMIMEFKTRTIVQFCNTVEEGQEKCHMYWPTKEGEPVEYGRTKVTLQSEATTPDYTTRKLHICNERGGKSEREGHVVTQFHFTTWPEHGHPTSTGSIIELIDLLTRAQMNSGNKAITVVCNDGVGRSGAFLCIHSQLERLKTEGEVDVFKYLKTARTRRIGLLSELDHYVFCHEVLADYVESFDPYANFKDM